MNKHFVTFLVAGLILSCGNHLMAENTPASVASVEKKEDIKVEEKKITQSDKSDEKDVTIEVKKVEAQQVSKSSNDDGKNTLSKVSSACSTFITDHKLPFIIGGVAVSLVAVIALLDPFGWQAEDEEDDE